MQHPSPSKPCAESGRKRQAPSDEQPCQHQYIVTVPANDAATYRQSTLRFAGAAHTASTSLEAPFPPAEDLLDVSEHIVHELSPVVDILAMLRHMNDALDRLHRSNSVGTFWGGHPSSSAPLSPMHMQLCISDLRRPYYARLLEIVVELQAELQEHKRMLEADLDRARQMVDVDVDRAVLVRACLDEAG
eukprot:CAMPEP_0181325968 /NCGR_PEP_ID=MMETSP1101-20121128/21228_1 /TAXON_ID=46948 /ORGANISM="Rhodomonas abbreviata, Strain Caron Lab Isolate" /LENGTH=188 /DNA_ID=CAMNT_0023434351 /DNA_START=157 /DNA_END=719 /DNA_ORIENTATION=+